jgi:hypothetical protein
MTKLIGEIIKEASQAEKKSDKVQILKSNECPALLLTLKFLFDPTVNLYTNNPPVYKQDPAPLGLSFNSLYSEAKKLYIFLKETAITPSRKDQLLIQTLESMHPVDSELIYNRLKNSNLLRLNGKIINEAFPGLIANEKSTK